MILARFAAFGFVVAAMLLQSVLIAVVAFIWAVVVFMPTAFDP